ncbi:MAG: hypothetical protein ABSC92_03170 [Rhizomicrobium sp.]
MGEAADWLRISRRALQELVKQHPHYYANGRRKLFQESDITALRAALRQSSFNGPQILQEADPQRSRPAK